MIRWTVCFTALAILIAAMAEAATLEVPQNGGNASGIGYFSGWKCPPNNNISIVVDGGTPIPVPSGVRRGDTSSACGNDGFNGYISQINFNLFGPGVHTAVARQNGVQFAQSTFTVTTFGTNFLTGASDNFYSLVDFPQPGKTTTVQWNQGQQNFVIVGTTGGNAQCPVNAPITNLQSNCPSTGYVYARQDAQAALLTTGQTARVCVVVASAPNDTACFGGSVSSSTTFTLTAGNLNGGPYSALLAGSSGNIANSGNVLNFTVGISGVGFLSFNGLNFQTTIAGPSAAATASETDDAVSAIGTALWGQDETSAGSDTLRSQSALVEQWGAMQSEDATRVPNP